MATKASSKTKTSTVTDRVSVDKTKTRTFAVTGRVSVDVMIEINAGSWEDAVAQALQLKNEDFITINGDFSDGRPLEITTIWVS